ncbi:MAG: hypothetical protein BJ554DRAFT_4957 [Olpidium bornovanus]|uniref:Uncharacterized protein n=1 Tax=Olpidium bornovanus TaxID=278681 RepID=A0A8H7ZM43_9FUNG|nr:MAG: hypothetical protein BJ554DRAFT_4957 [Olpidium bornovanus]
MVTRRGECCASPDCDARIHDRCALRYFSAGGGSARERGCPACNSAWAGPVVQAGSEKVTRRRGSSPTNAGEIPSSQADENNEERATEASDNDIQEVAEALTVDEEHEEPLNPAAPEDDEADNYQ